LTFADWADLSTDIWSPHMVVCLLFAKRISKSGSVKLTDCGQECCPRLLLMRVGGVRFRPTSAWLRFSVRGGGLMKFRGVECEKDWCDWAFSDETAIRRCCTDHPATEVRLLCEYSSKRRRSGLQTFVALIETTTMENVMLRTHQSHHKSRIAKLPGTAAAVSLTVDFCRPGSASA
jgi:hypothetical protein